jgi:hypothetical protein
MSKKAKIDQLRNLVSSRDDHEQRTARKLAWNNYWSKWSDEDLQTVVAIGDIYLPEEKLSAEDQKTINMIYEKYERHRPKV